MQWPACRSVQPSAAHRSYMNIEDIEEIDAEFGSGDIRRMEMIARRILCAGRTHEFMKNLSSYADRFNEILRQTSPGDRSYLALPFILVEHLTEVKNGKCACSIVKKDMFNSPEELSGIVEIIDVEINERDDSRGVLSRCLSCGKTYESKEVEWGHGRKVFWTLRSS